jgi:ubiquinone/menaquinone biosynthesis C-methylase UbiE
MPVPDASQDIVTTMYLFHELPPGVRRTVIRDLARVLKPGGLLVFVDSLQKGDRPDGWDGFLEGFPERFHEPYYRHYTIDDLDSAFEAAGLAAIAAWPAFLSKVMVRSKADSP